MSLHMMDRYKWIRHEYITLGTMALCHRAGYSSTADGVVQQEIASKQAVSNVVESPILYAQEKTRCLAA